MLDLVVAGMLNKQIAARLDAAEKTVKVHRGRVMKKMEADSVADLVRMTQRMDSDRETRPPGGRGSERWSQGPGPGYPAYRLGGGAPPGRRPRGRRWTFDADAYA